MTTNPLNPDQEAQLRGSLADASSGVQPHLMAVEAVAKTARTRQIRRASLAGIATVAVIATAIVTAVNTLSVPDEQQQPMVVASAPTPNATPELTPAPSGSASTPASLTNTSKASATSSESVNVPLAPSPGSHTAKPSTPAPVTPKLGIPDGFRLPHEGQAGWVTTTWRGTECGSAKDSSLTFAGAVESRSTKSEGPEQFDRESVAVFPSVAKAEEFMASLRNEFSCGITRDKDGGGTNTVTENLAGAWDQGFVGVLSYIAPTPEGQKPMYSPGGSYALAARIGSTVLIKEGYAEWINMPNPDPRALEDYRPDLDAMAAQVR